MSRDLVLGKQPCDTCLLVLVLPRDDLKEPGAEGFRNHGALPVQWSRGRGGVHRQDWFGCLEKGVRAKRQSCSWGRDVWGQRASSGARAVKGGRAGSCGVKVSQVRVTAKQKVRCLDKNCS